MSATRPAWAMTTAARASFFDGFPGSRRFIVLRIPGERTSA